jgi:hypothetical protein
MAGEGVEAYGKDFSLSVQHCPSIDWLPKTFDKKVMKFIVCTEIIGGRVCIPLPQDEEQGPERASMV